VGLTDKVAMGKVFVPVLRFSPAYQLEPQSLNDIALGYEMHDRGFESRQGLGIFSSNRVQTGSGAHPASYPMGTTGIVPWGKAAGA
jgi:hypothetical protein